MTAIPAPVFIIGEAMIELSGLDGKTAQVGVAGDTFNTAVYLARAGVPLPALTAGVSPPALTAGAPAASASRSST